MTTEVSTNQPLRVIVVCTGNLCRSPTAEQLLEARLPGNAEVRITSAGTLASNGEPMHETSAQWSRRLGGDPTHHRATYLTARVLAPVDLAFGLAREHRRAIVELRPGLIKSAFTLTEFARLAAAIPDDELAAAVATVDPRRNPADRLRAVLPLFARARRLLPPSADETIDDVIDPIGRAPQFFEQSARQIDRAVTDVVRVLSAVGAADPQARLAFGVDR